MARGVDIAIFATGESLLIDYCCRVDDGRNEVVLNGTFELPAVLFRGA